MKENFDKEFSGYESICEGISLQLFLLGGGRRNGMLIRRGGKTNLPMLLLSPDPYT